MSRLAILIHSENADPRHPLPGPETDARNFRQFLMSPVGGGWENGEIRMVPHPTVEELIDLIEVANSVDYVLFVFSGHGGYIGREMSIMLAEGNNIIMTRDIISRIHKKATFVFDACRNLVSEEFDLRMPEMGGILNEAADRQAESRAIFDGAIEATTAQKTVLYACRRSEDAVDTPNGAVFISTLLNEAARWAQFQPTDKPRTLSSADAFHRARSTIGAMGFEQTPTLDPISGFGGNPPFAVWLPPAGR